MDIMNLKKINNPFGGLTYYRKSTTSTMKEAMDLLEEQTVEGSIVIADYQTNGIGRIPGRKWNSSPGENLTFTLILKREYIGKGYSTTPLKAGLALSKVINELSGIKASVKWPNDVIVDGRKISGILCQSQKGYVLIGIGININQLEFDDTIKDSTTSLSLLTQKGFSLEMILSRFLKSFNDVLTSDIWLEELNNSLYKIGERVEFAIGNPENKHIVKGVLVGLDDQGKVIIKDNTGTTRGYLSGEFIQ